MGGRLHVGAQQVGVVELGHEPDLDRGGAVRRAHEVRRDVGLGGEIAGHGGGGIVGADHAEQVTAGIERGDVAGDVAGAADGLLGALQVDHGGRRLGRDAADAAVAEAVEHQVADDQDALGRERGEDGLEGGA